MKKRFFLIVFAALIIFSAFSGCAKRPSADYVSGTSTGNSANMGFVTSDGTWIYYVNVNDGGSIYRMRTDGTENSLFKTCQAYYLNVYGDYLYFLDYSEHGYIHKMKKTGGDATVVYKAIGTYLNVYDGNLYFSITPSKNTQYGQVYSVDTDGNVPRRVTFDFAGNVTCYDGFVYSTDDKGNIRRYSITDRKDEIFLEADAKQLCVNAIGLFYVTNSSKLIMCDFDGKSTDIAENVSTICLDGSNLYYSGENGSGIIAYNLSNNEKTQLSYEENIIAINTEGNYIYYFTSNNSGEGWRMTRDGKSVVSLSEL